MNAGRKSSSSLGADLQSRIDNATALQDSGRLEESIQAFRELAEDTPNVDLKTAALLGVVRGYLRLGRLGNAEKLLKEINTLAPADVVVRMNVSFVMACVSAQKGNHRIAALQFGKMLQESAEVLNSTEYRDARERNRTWLYCPASKRDSITRYGNRGRYIEWISRVSNSGTSPI